MDSHGGRAGVAALLCLALSGCSLLAQAAGEPVGGSPRALALSAATVLTQVDRAGPYSADDVAAVSAADLGIAGTAVTETAVSDDGAALCFGIERTTVEDSTVLVVVVGSGAVGQAWDVTCAAALPAALPALAYDAAVAADMERVLDAASGQPGGAPITGLASGLTVGDRTVELSEGVSLVDADTTSGRLCVALGDPARYIRSSDSLLGDLLPRPGAICSTRLVQEGSSIEIGRGTATSSTMSVSPDGSVGLSSFRFLEPSLEDDVTPLGREVLDARLRADEAVLAANAERITPFLDDAYASGTLDAVSTQEQTGTWAIDGPGGTLFVADSVRWDRFERTADGWCMRLLWDDRTATATGGISPPSC